MPQFDFPIPNFNQGMYMVWHVSSQTASQFQVTLKDDTKEYFSEKNGEYRSDTVSVLSVGDHKIEGNKLTLTLDINSGSVKPPIINSVAIVGNTSSPAGYMYHLCIEDHEDNDYNDICVMMTAWNRRG